MSKTQYFFFYDLETFGINPTTDRIAQFAGIRTDRDFNIVDEPINLYCKQYDDYIPNPEAIIITGITPEYCNQHGLEEAEFTRRIHTEFSKPDTCILGYNSIRFDDEMIRYLFYRNFYDPYAHTWQNGNSRWDLLDVVRATFALRPEGISWPMDDNHLPILKLEALTTKNNLLHDKAHDALSDVYATIEIAKLIHEQQPRLFNYYFNHRRAREVKSLINLTQLTPLVHISGMFGNARHNLSVIAPLCMHPWNKNLLIAIDLMGDLDSLLSLDASTLKELLYTKAEDLPKGQSRIPFKNIHLNRAPILAPFNTLKDAPLVGTDPQYCLNNHQILLEHRALLTDKANKIFLEKPDFSKQAQDVEARLYDRFFDAQDKSQMELIPTLTPQVLQDYPFDFTDDRLDPLLFRYRAKNYPGSLNEVEKEIWARYTTNKTQALKAEYSTLYQQLLDHYQNDSDIHTLLKNCSHYYTD